MAAAARRPSLQRQRRETNEDAYMDCIDDAPTGDGELGTGGRRLAAPDDGAGSKQGSPAALGARSPGGSSAPQHRPEAAVAKPPPATASSLRVAALMRDYGSIMRYARMWPEGPLSLAALRQARRPA
jgi:hypothetical protein